jgi:hypothetical protein
MPGDDDKTQPARRAVQRRAADVANLPTRHTTPAVKRRAPARPDPAQRLAEPFRVQLLPRAELLNAVGEKDNGWRAWNDYDEVECLRFVLEAEPLLKTIKRGLIAPDDYYFDVMADDANVGALQLEAVHAMGSRLTTRTRPKEGLGRLFDASGQERAAFVLREHYEVQCLDPAHRLLLELRPTPTGARGLARRLTVATVTTLTGGLLGQHRGLEVALEPSATPFERLLLVSGLVLCEAWLIERRRHAHRSRGPLHFFAGGIFELLVDDDRRQVHGVSPGDHADCGQAATAFTTLASEPARHAH